MTSFLNMLKSMAIAGMMLLFFVAVTMSSCGGTPKDQGSESTESVDAHAAESEEHPEGEEQPTDSAAAAVADKEHPEGEEQPTDSVAAAVADEEHPEGEKEAEAKGEGEQ